MSSPQNHHLRLCQLEEVVRYQTEVIKHIQKQLKQQSLPKRNESYYQHLLETLLGATHMHIPDVGITDITTSDTHVEIKDWKRYHQVPGQLATYQQAVPRVNSVVYFFGAMPSYNRFLSIRSLMTRHNISMYSIDSDDVITEYPSEVSAVSSELKTFLQEKGVYCEGDKVLLSDVRKAFARHIGKSVSKNLDRGTFAQVDERWEFGRGNVCKSCGKLAGKGCCSEYKSTERGKEIVVLHFGFRG